jgi:hypothetical protein
VLELVESREKIHTSSGFPKSDYVESFAGGGVATGAGVPSNKFDGEGGSGVAILVAYQPAIADARAVRV